MKAVYPPAQVAPYDPSFSGAFPLATRWTKLATRAASGLVVTVVVGVHGAGRGAKKMGVMVRLVIGGDDRGLVECLMWV